MIDLHVHSLMSDGEFSPSDVVRRAKKEGISVLALTDHDSFQGTAEARNMCDELGITFVHGVEFEAATDISKSQYIHILGYNFKDCSLIESYLKNLKEERISLIHSYVELLNRIGMACSFEDISSLTPGEHLTAYHIPIFLIRNGYYSKFEDARSTFIDPGSKYYIHRNFYDVEFVINLILQAGGVPVLAHPGRLPQKGEELDSYISFLKQLGMVGMETYYAEYPDSEIAFYVSLAEKYNMLKTAGSDFHSDDSICIGMTPPNEDKIVHALLNYNSGNC